FKLSFFFSSRRRHTSSTRDWSSDVCSSDLAAHLTLNARRDREQRVEVSAAQRNLIDALLVDVVIQLVGELDERAHAFDRDRLGRSEERRVGKECRCRGSLVE